MKKIWKPLTAAILIAVLFAVAYLAGDRAETGYETSIYDEDLIIYDGWETVSGTEIRKLSLPEYVRPSQEGTVTISNTLPRLINEGTFLGVYSSNAYLTAGIGGKVIYETRQGTDRETVSRWNYIHIEPADAGEEVTLAFSGSEPFYTGMLSEILLGTYGELMMYATAKVSYDRWINVSILFVGFLVLLFSVVTVTNKRKSTDYLVLGILIMLMGICGISRTVTADVPARGYGGLLSVSRVVYSLLPALYCVYRGRSFEGKKKKRYESLAWSSLLYTAASTVLRMTAPPVIQPVLHYVSNAVFCLVCLFCLADILREDHGERPVDRALLTAALSALIIGHITGSFTHLGETAFRAVRPETAGALVFALLQTAAGLLSAYYHLERQLDMERELNEGKIKLMINQIKPHFINNVMTAIRSMIQYDPDEADQMVYRFNKYLTYNIDALSSTELCSFSMELKHIETYLTIELTRLRPRLQVRYDVRTDDFEIPPLSIQPFVENAVKHGIAPKMEVGTLYIGTDETEDCYEVTIRDDGVGFDMEAPFDQRGGHGLGMENAVQRLKLLVNGSVRIESSPGKGTTVTVSVPKLKEEDFDEDDIG